MIFEHVDFQKYGKICCWMENKVSWMVNYLIEFAFMVLVPQPFLGKGFRAEYEACSHSVWVGDSTRPSSISAE